jgi:hypothetical protein
MENSNGAGMPDRDFGLDRAAERRSAQGTAHSNASAKVKPGKTVDHSKDRSDAVQTREQRMSDALATWERTHK